MKRSERASLVSLAPRCHEVRGTSSGASSEILSQRVKQLDKGSTTFGLHDKERRFERTRQGRGSKPSSVASKSFGWGEDQDS